MDINELYHLANIFMYNTFEEQKNKTKSLLEFLSMVNYFEYYLYFYI